MHHWQTSRRAISLERPLVMGILNVTPDSFSDGGKYATFETALKRAEEMIDEGVDIIDIGGESTRPGSKRVSIEEEIERTIPVIEAISKRFDIPISIDTTRSETATASVNAGAEIINDISGLRWDAKIAKVAAKYSAGLILMHSRGEFETMHSQPVSVDIISEVAADLRRAIETAAAAAVARRHIALDIGIGFGKTAAQNLELIAKLDKLRAEFEDLPFLLGASRKSFIGKVLADAPAEQRLFGSLATAAIAAWNGAKIFRVHDVAATVETLRIAKAISDHR